MPLLTCDICGKVRQISSLQHARKHANGNVCRVCSKYRAHARAGRVRHKFSEHYNAMKQKCYNPNNSLYETNGAKGIYVCEEWLKDRQLFFKFLTDNNYDPKLNRLSRIDKTGPFSPENCEIVPLRNPKTKEITSSPK